CLVDQLETTKRPPAEHQRKEEYDLAQQHEPSAVTEAPARWLRPLGRRRRCIDLVRQSCFLTHRWFSCRFGVCWTVRWSVIEAVPKQVLTPQGRLGFDKLGFLGLFG